MENNKLVVKNKQILSKIQTLEKGGIPNIDVSSSLAAFSSAKDTFLNVSKMITPAGAILTRNPDDLKYVDDAVPRQILTEITAFWDFENDPPQVVKVNRIVTEETIQNNKELAKYVGTEIADKFHIFVTCNAKLTLHFPNGIPDRVITDTGTCDLIYTNKGVPMFEMAYKGAVTDAFKRCCARLGICEDVYGKPPKNYKHELILFYIFFDKVIVSPTGRGGAEFLRVWKEIYYANSAEKNLDDLFKIIGNNILKKETTSEEMKTIITDLLMNSYVKNKFNLESCYKYVSNQYEPVDF